MLYQFLLITTNKHHHSHSTFCTKVSMKRVGFSLISCKLFIHEVRHQNSFNALFHEYSCVYITIKETCFLLCAVFIKNKSLIILSVISLSRRLPFQQDVEYGNTTSHLGDCDGRLQHYDMDASGCVQSSEGRLHLVAQSLITPAYLSLNIMFW